MTKLTFLLDIQDCIDERIKLLAEVCDENEDVVKANYVRRVNNLQEAYHYKTIQDSYSHYMVKAWQGTKAYFLNRTNWDKEKGSDD